MLFYPINLIVAYPLNENKPQLLAIFENWDLKVAMKYTLPWNYNRNHGTIVVP